MLSHLIFYFLRKHQYNQEDTDIPIPYKRQNGLSDGEENRPAKLEGAVLYNQQAEGRA